jgi:hypothetical protein
MIVPVHAYEVAPYAAAAFEAGVPLRGGFPELIPIPGGYAVPNLARPGQYVTSQDLGSGVLVCSSDAGQSVCIAGMVGEAVASRIVWQRAPEFACTDPHGPHAAPLRDSIGQQILAVEDSMVRARLLDAFDAWGAVLGSPIDGSDDGPDGLLCASADTSLEVRLLRVTCPSTGRRYVHLVPPETRTAADGRRWVMGLRTDTQAKAGPET